MNAAKSSGFKVLAQSCGHCAADGGQPLTPSRQETAGVEGAGWEERPFGEPQSAEEPFDIELGRARERGRGRHASHPLQIPWRGWYDILWRTYREMQSDRLLSIAGGVSFFVLLAIFPAITALVSAYGLFFSPSVITNNLSLLNDIVPDNVLSIVHEQTSRIAANSGSALRSPSFLAFWSRSGVP